MSDFIKRRNLDRSYFGKGIPVASGFDLNGKAPLDARTVVPTMAALEAMPDIQKYNGLSVFVEENGQNYQLVNGEWLSVGTETEVVDNLTSTSPNVALSANQGRVLKETIEAHESDTEKHITDDERQRWNDTYTKDETMTKEEVGTELNTKVNVESVHNGLDVVEQGKVLDARQGKVLKDLVDTKADDQTTKAELAKKANAEDLGTAAVKNTGIAIGDVVEVGVDGKISSSILPSIAINDTYVVTNITEAMALEVEVGDVVMINPSDVSTLEDTKESEILKEILRSGSMTYICVDAKATEFNDKFKPLQSAGDVLSKAEIEKLVADETKRATAAEQALQTAVDAANSDIEAETVRATAVEAGLRTDIDATNVAVEAETTRAKAAEEALQTAVDANAKSITDETARATAAEEALQTNIDASQTAIEEEVTRATAAEEALQTAVDVNAEAILAETARAEAAEAELETSIASNGALIEAETTRAKAAEEALQTAVDANAKDIEAEVVRATAAEAELEKVINDGLNTKVNTASIHNSLEDAEAGKVLDARQGKVLKDLIDGTQAAVEAETTRATAAEEALQTAVDANAKAITDETARATAAEEALQTAIETTEAGLKTELEEAVQGLNNSIGETNTTLKAHVENTDVHITADERTSWNSRTRKAVAVIGNGAATEIVINHKLETMDFALTVRESVAPYALVFVEAQIVDENNIKLLFGQAPALNEFKVTIVG